MKENEINLSLKGIGKRFNLDKKRTDGALARLKKFFMRERVDESMMALDNISLEARRGETIGIIGKNGSGKSTLLRIIAEIYVPDGGTLEYEGEIIYISGLGLGIMPKLTMRENINLMGAILGMKGEESLRTRLEAFIERINQRRK